MVRTSGSRAPLYQCALGLMAAAAVSSQLRHKFRVVILLVVIAISYTVLTDDRFVVSFYSRLTAAGDSTTERITGAGLEFVRLMLDHPFGIGMGQESNVKDYRIAELRTPIEFTEDGRSRMAIEGGVFAILGQLVTLSIFLRVSRLSWRTRSDQARIAGAAMTPALLYLLTNCLWYDHTGSALWWFFIGAWLAITLRVSSHRAIPTTVVSPWLSTYATISRQPSVWQSEFI